jgi:ribosomal protein L37E
LSDRKYRQPGYMDRGEERQKKQGEKPPSRDNTFGPRPLNMAASRTVSRCAQCGTVLPAFTEAGGQCAKCGFELHSCKQCTHFDPGSRFECTQPIAERIPRKDARNECTLYNMRAMVEKETSAAAVRSDDARRAFENLFKK